LNSLLARRNSERKVESPPPPGADIWLTVAWQSDYLKLTLLASALLHIVIIGLLSLRPPEKTVRNESRVPSLSVTLPSGSLGKVVAIPTHGQPPGGKTKSFKRKYFHQAEGISESGPIEQIDTSLYADPENIDDAASIIVAPELPLPQAREVTAGILRLRIFVSEEGAVDQIELIETSLQEDYATSLMETFKESRFSPGMLHGKPVKSWRMIEINYFDP